MSTRRSATDGSGGPIILVVEDSDDQRQLLRTHFERAGCQVILASTGEEGMVEAHAHPPRLAVIDLLLPGISGWQVAAEIRKSVPSCSIAISSVLDSGEYPVSDAALPKPVTGVQIRRMIDELIPEWTRP